MSARKKEKSSIKLAAESPLLHWLLTIGLALFVLIFPYDRALFNGYEYGFESSIYSAAIFSYVLLAVTAVYTFRSGWQLNNHRSLLSIVVLLFPVVYWLSSMQAVSSYYASFMTYVIFLMAGVFLTGLYAAERLPARKLIEYTLMLTSYIIVLYGILNLFGQQYSRDALWLAHDGYRLTSVFQYSNTYAGFLTAIFLIAVYYAVTCTRWYMRFANAIMLVPIFISFMLTYSRGAIVVIPVMVLILIPFLRFVQQIAYIVYLGLSALLSLIILGKLTANADAIAIIVQPTAEKAPSTISMFDALPLQNWLLLAAATLVNAGLIMLLHKKLYPWLEAKTAKLAERKWSFAAVPGAIIVIGVLAVTILLTSSGVRGMLPDKIASRFENINLQQHSFLERWTFYEDGLRVAEDYPLLGAGGGGWQSLYEQYQNNPYWSRQAHSYFVQTLVEVGWLGFIILIGLLAYMFLMYIRAYIRFPERRGSHLIFFIFALTILIHSAIDFDMSYVYLSALVFISLGCMLAPYGKLLTINRLSSLKLNGRMKFIYPSFIGLLALLLIIFSAREFGAIRTFSQTVNLAGQGQTNLNNLIDPLNKAIRTSPNHTIFALTKSQWLEQAYAQTQNQTFKDDLLKTLDQAKKNDPYNRSILLQLIKSLDTSDGVEQKLKLIEEGLIKFQWDIQFYEMAIVEYTTAGSSARQTDVATTETYFNRVIELKDEIEQKIAKLAALPPEQSQGRSFSFTPAINAAIGQIYYEQQNYEASIAILQPGITGNLEDASIRKLVRYYLSSLAAIGQSDVDLNNQLIQFYETKVVEYLNPTDSASAEANAKLALALKAEIEQEIIRLAALPQEQKQGYIFTLTPTTVEALKSIQ